MNKLTLNEEGFITNYLISGPVTTPFSVDTKDENQLNYEVYLRSVVASNTMSCPTEEISLGGTSSLSMPWRYYYSYHNWFVDVSEFYSVLQKIELLAVVDIVLEEEAELTAELLLWTYGAAEIWLAGKKVCHVPKPVYKPICKKAFKVKLHRGENRLLLKMQNLGCRDTRNIFGLQFADKRDKLKISLPDWEKAGKVAELEQWLADLKINGSKLHFRQPLPCPVYLSYPEPIIDRFKESNSKIEKIGVQESMLLREGSAHVAVSGEMFGQRLERRMERLEFICPKYNKSGLSRDEAVREQYQEIADIVQTNRGSNIGFSMFNILARYHLGQVKKEDEGLLYETLDQIEARYDCSDFLMAALLRFHKNFTVTAKVEARIKEVILNYRYWMDQDGADGMCFWSENHALMFYGCSMTAGAMYPDEYFPRAGMVGKQLCELGQKRVLEWLDDVEKKGYEEFLSAGYMCVTFGALLTVYDYGSVVIKKRAGVLLDRLFEEILRHTFCGSVIAPQGRVYRDVVYPFSQAVQSLIHLMDADSPSGSTEWLIFLASSEYKLPLYHKHLMSEEQDAVFQTGNASIHLKKTGDYILTSVASVKNDSYVWENISFQQDVDVSSYIFVKSLNERYHGTTHFEPGVYGYQQHMWYAALANDTVIFANHPGASTDLSAMRPGYWYGNGEMPALVQKGSLLGAIYSISEEHPISFTHLFFPVHRFDEIRKQGNWIFARKRNGYAAIWCSSVLLSYDDYLTDCELRCYDREAAYLCFCGSAGEYNDFNNFILAAEAFHPEFSKERLQLEMEGRVFLNYQKGHNRTQII